MNDILELILIVILVIIVFQLFFGTGRCKNEGMDSEMANLIGGNDNQLNLVGVKATNNNDGSLQIAGDVAPSSSSMNSLSTLGDNDVVNVIGEVEADRNDTSVLNVKAGNKIVKVNKADAKKVAEELVHKKEQEKVAAENLLNKINAADSEESLSNDVSSDESSGRKVRFADPVAVVDVDAPNRPVTHAPVPSSNFHFNNGSCPNGAQEKNLDNYVKTMLMRDMTPSGEVGPWGSESDEDSAVISSDSEGGNPINPPQKMTRAELDGYQNDFFAFFDKVNGTSKDASPDAVDNMNQYMLNPRAYQGETLQDIHNKLTANQSHKTLQDSQYDRINALPVFTDETANGKTPTDEMWRYKNERPENGGRPSSGIRGFTETESEYASY